MLTRRMWANWFTWAYCQIRKIAGAHASGMPGAFSPPARVSYPDMHHGTCVTHVPWCMPWSLTGGFHGSRWRGKRSRHSRRMRNLQFYVSGKRSMNSYYSHNITPHRARSPWDIFVCAVRQSSWMVQSLLWCILVNICPEHFQYLG